MPTPAEEFNAMLSLGSIWVEELEQLALRDGIPLNEEQLRDARSLRIAHPERIRLLKVPRVPLPQDPVLLAVCESTRAISPGTWALSARYGILIRADRWGQREVVVHELVHTSQYEKLGGVRPFLQKYLEECQAVGFPKNEMEQAAILTAAKMCRVAEQ